MKKDFFDILIELMETNPNIYFISAGLGWPRTNEIAHKFADRYIQTEASEQTAADIVVGLALAHKIPVMYTITSFYWRCAETLRTYLAHERLHCILIGAGVKEEYAIHDGYSHSATDAPVLFDALSGFMQHYPDSKDELIFSLNHALANKTPNFINIHR